MKRCVIFLLFFVGAIRMYRMCIETDRGAFAQLLNTEDRSTNAAEKWWIDSDCSVPLKKPILGVHDRKRIVNMGMPKCGSRSIDYFFNPFTVQDLPVISTAAKLAIVASASEKLVANIYQFCSLVEILPSFHKSITSGIQTTSVTFLRSCNWRIFT